jgi:hypothetical protein
MSSGSITTAPEEDPVMRAFLGFLEKDLKTRPGRRSRLSKRSLARAIRLTKPVKVSDRDKIPSTVSV